MTLSISRDRLHRDLMALAEHGRDPAGGMTRLALTEADARARAHIRGEMQALGLDIWHDEVGNLIGRRAGTEAEAPAVATGSHLDSVPQGGRFDGPLGVCAGVEALRALDEAGVKTRRPLEVIVFTGEEGSRFRRGTIGSAAMSGDVDVRDIWALRDAGGVSFRDALRTYGDEGAPRPALRDAEDLHAFVELHIEQGGVLESRKIPIGAVTTINGLTQLIGTVTGDANHAGATPMDMRKDALCAAAEMILAVEFIAKNLHGGAVATCGDVDARPGAFNIIPGLATFRVDLRAPSPATLAALEEEMRRSFEDIARRRGLPYTLDVRQRVAPGPMDELVIAAVEAGAKDAGLASMRMPSGAIHDALHMASKWPSGMIFVPSKGGKSHCPEEETALEDMARGVETLAHTLVRLAS